MATWQEVEAHLIAENGTVINSGRYPLVVFKNPECACTVLLGGYNDDWPSYCVAPLAPLGDNYLASAEDAYASAELPSAYWVSTDDQFGTHLVVDVQDYDDAPALAAEMRTFAEAAVRLRNTPGLVPSRWWHRTVSRALVGIAFDPGSDPLTVANVLPSGPAELAGIRPTDIVVSLDPTQIMSPAEILSRLEETSPGDELEVVLEDRTVVLTVAEVEAYEREHPRAKRAADTLQSQLFQLWRDDPIEMESANGHVTYSAVKLGSLSLEGAAVWAFDPAWDDGDGYFGEGVLPTIGHGGDTSVLIHSLMRSEGGVSEQIGLVVDFYEGAWNPAVAAGEEWLWQAEVGSPVPIGWIFRGGLKVLAPGSFWTEGRLHPRAKLHHKGKPKGFHIYASLVLSSMGDEEDIQIPAEGDFTVLGAEILDAPFVFMPLALVDEFRNCVPPIPQAETGWLLSQVAEVRGQGELAGQFGVTLIELAHAPNITADEREALLTAADELVSTEWILEEADRGAYRDPFGLALSSLSTRPSRTKAEQKALKKAATSRTP